MTIEQIGTKAEHGGTEQIITSATFVSGLAPLTFMSGFAEIDLDLRTGKVELLKFVSVADCGRVINPTLARVQAEGGILMGIGLALFEEVHYGENGKLQTDSFMQYKIPCREDLPADCIEVSFAESEEPSGPYGLSPSRGVRTYRGAGNCQRAVQCRRNPHAPAALYTRKNSKGDTRRVARSLPAVKPPGGSFWPGQTVYAVCPGVFYPARLPLPGLAQLAQLVAVSQKAVRLPAQGQGLLLPRSSTACCRRATQADSAASADARASLLTGSLNRRFSARSCTPRRSAGPRSAPPGRLPRPAGPA